MPTLAQLQARLDAYLASELRILQSQEYTVGQRSSGRHNRRADLDVVRDEIAKLTVQLAAHPDNGAARSMRRVRHLRPNC